MELFYYTSTETLSYILKNGNIYATNIRYMNDSEEYLNGLRELYSLSQNNSLLQDWISKRELKDSLLDEIKKTFSEDNLEENMQNMEYYSISFCKKNDLLSQWAIYAKESGVSIKMNFEEASYKFFSKSLKEGEQAEWNLIPQSVYYFTRDAMMNKEDIYNSVAYDILDQLYVADSMDQAEWKKERWRYVSTLVKRYDFYQEEECRLVFEPNESAFPPCIEYRHDQKVLKPYLDIECDGGWPIWEIMIGPGFNQQVVYDSMEHFLNHTKVMVGYKTIEDYAIRMEKYLEPYKKKLAECRDYVDLSDLFMKKDWIKDVEFEEAEIIFTQKMDAIRKFVSKIKYNSDIVQYFSQHHFTNSGIVLTKSSIPYIF